LNNEDALGELEQELQELDSAAWKKFQRKAVRYVCVRHKRRHYAQLFQGFWEVKGYAYFKRQGYHDIQFIDEAGVPTPDLYARRNDSVALMEVKSVEESEEELVYFEGKQDYFDLDLSRNVHPAREVIHALPASLKRKANHTIQHARGQLLNFAVSNVDRRILYLFVRLDSHCVAKTTIKETEEFLRTQQDEQIEVIYSFLSTSIL